MLEEKVKKYFRQFPRLRVLFFFDAEREREEEVDTLQIEQVRVVKWNHNDFYLKTMLYGEWSGEKVFLYFSKAAPQKKEEFKQFALLGILVANKELSLDNVGEFMDEFSLKPHQKSLVAKYMKELKYSSVQEVCKPVLQSAVFEEPILIRGLVSSFLRFSKIKSWTVIIGKMTALALPGQEEELKRFQNKIRDNGLLDILKRHTKDHFAVELKDLSSDQLMTLLRVIYYNKITQSLSETKEEDPYRTLKIKAPDTIIYFNQLLQEVDRDPRVQERLEEGLNIVARDIQGSKLISAYGVNANFAHYADDMLWEIMVLEAPNITINPAASIGRLEQLSLQQGLDEVISNSLEFMLQAAQMFERVNNIRTYILDHPDDYIRAYTEDWMYIDMAYRKAVSQFRYNDFSEVPAALNLDMILAQVNSSYETYLDSLNREWLKCLSQFGFDYHKISTPKQYDFYKKEVAPYDQKVAVIISDALRYEAAASLLSEMHGDSKNTAVLRHQLASIPSKTYIGMAQLLPHKELIFKDKQVSVDGISSEGTANRAKILQANHDDAIAVQYADIAGKTKVEMRAIFKHKLVYLYHDEIDNTGDKKSSQHNTFEAVAKTIGVLKQFIKSLHSAYNVARVLVTSDHGFLYNDRKIEDNYKEEKPNGEQPSHNRYDITEALSSPNLGYQISLSQTTKFKEQKFITIPASVNRYKKQGVGHQFVHGGGSLQELVVPIIESSRKRKEVTKKVMPVLIQQGKLRVISNILRTNILQGNKVSRFEKEITIKIGLYKDLNLLSNEQTIVMNSTEDAPSQRTHKIELTLNNGAGNESFLKLKVFDENDKLNALIEELVENNTLLPTDF